MPQTIGIDLGGTSMRAGLITPDGTMLCCRQAPTHRERPIAEVAAALADLARGLDGWEESSAVGIGVPGAVRPDGTVAACSNLPGLVGFPLRRRLSAALGRPCHICNDAAAAGLAEARIGAGRGCDTAVYVTVSTGIGGAVLIHGSPLVGAHGFSAELCSLPLSLGKEPFARAGTCCGDDLVRLAAQRMPQERFADAGDVYRLASAGQEEAVLLLKEFHTRLGQMFCILAGVIDPDVFILGGGLMKQAEILIPAVRQAYQQLAPQALRAIPFHQAELTEPGTIGAGLLAIQEEEICCQRK